MREAFAFLTVVGRSATPTPRARCVGSRSSALVLGAAVGGSWWLFTKMFPPTVAAALAIGVDLALTGMLHFDGLVDSADGLLPHLPRDRRLEVMRTPDAGAFGVGAALLVLLVRVACLASMTPEVMVVIGVWCTSRAIVAVAPARLRYAPRQRARDRVHRWQRRMDAADCSRAGHDLDCHRHRVAGHRDGRRDDRRLRCRARFRPSPNRWLHR